MSTLKEKFEIQYMAELGIIDLFGLSLSEEELKKRVQFDIKDEYGSHFHSFCEYSRVKKPLFRRSGNQHSGYRNRL